MPDTPRTLAALQALLADNVAGEISAQDVRDFLVSVFALTTKGDLLVIGSDGIQARLPGSTDGYVLTYDTAETYGIKWAPASSAAHDILSATHSDAAADAVSRGSIIVGNSTPAWDELVLGASGLLLISDGSDLRYSDFTTHKLTYDTGTMTIIQEATQAKIDAITYDDSVQSAIQLTRLRGTIASPTAVQSGDVLGLIQSRGLGTAIRSGSSLKFVAAENWGGTTAHGTRIEFFSMPIGSNSETLRLTIPDYGGLLIPEITAPGTPAANNAIVYVKDLAGVSRLYYKDDGGTERLLIDDSHEAAADPHTGYLKETDFDDIDFLVGTATGHTGAEIVVGTTPGGELGGTWASPTVDATHSGSAHHAEAHGISAHTAHANWKVFYSDGSGDEQELALGADGTFLQANGVAAAPTFAALVAGDIPVSTLYSEVQYVFTPDAGPGAVVTAGDQQGNIYHSGTNGFIATKLYVDAETAPGASGLPITVQYGDTDDLDTVASWTTIATVTASTNDNTVSTTSMTNATVPADRLVRMNVGTIVGSPTDVTVTLTAKKQLQT